MSVLGPARGAYVSTRSLGGRRSARSRDLFFFLWPSLWPGRQGAMGSAGYAYLSTGGSHVGARAIPPTPQVPSLRTADRNIPFSIDFAPDVASGDTVSKAQIAVVASPTSYAHGSGVPPSTDVTNTLLADQDVHGTVVTAILGNPAASAESVRGLFLFQWPDLWPARSSIFGVGGGAAEKGMQYTVRMVATTASGMVLQETIDEIICDQ